jgi:hypothetical protein
MSNLFERLTAAMDEAEARQESINHHTGQPKGTGMDTAHAVTKSADLKKVMGLVEEVVKIADEEVFPNGEEADPDTVSWAMEWKKILVPGNPAENGEEVAHDPAR